jgi:hypothetical protein
LHPGDGGGMPRHEGPVAAEHHAVGADFIEQEAQWRLGNTKALSARRGAVAGVRGRVGPGRCGALASVLHSLGPGHRLA